MVKIMNEVEVLVRIDEKNLQKVHEAISKMAKFATVKKVLDTYYYDELRQELKPDENMAIYQCFRVREKEEKAYLTYKIDKFNEDGKWLYSDENETEIGSVNEVKNIIKNLGLKELVAVDMVKTFYENDSFTFTVEEVKELGVFLEIESKKNLSDKKKIEEERKIIEHVISSMEVEASPDLGIGKPELLLRKKYKKENV